MRAARVGSAVMTCAVFLSGLLLAVRLNSQQNQSGQQAAQKGANRCEAAEYRQMDFVLGAWEVSNKGQKSAEVTLERTSASGCGLVETWRSVNGGGGNGLFGYSPVGKGWQYFWVPSSGQPSWLHEGKPTTNANEMEFTLTRTQADGTSHESHWTLTKTADDHIRELSVNTADGKTEYELIWSRK